MVTLSETTPFIRTKLQRPRLRDELQFQRAVQTCLWAMPAMNIIAMRLYAPTQAFFDKTWKPGDIEKVK